MVIGLWNYRGLILHNAVEDLRNRYRGSIAGWLWNVFIPLTQIMVFWVIFSVLMGYRLPERPDLHSRFNFAIFLCAGLLPWNAFADTLMRGVASLVGNAGYLKKLPVPEQLFVAQDVCAGFISALLSMSLFLLFCVFVAGYGPFWTWWQVLPAMVLFMSFAFGLGLFLSCLNVFFRDVQPLMSMVILLWFWLTPVVYAENIFQGSDHHWVGPLLRLNPAYHFVKLFRESIYLHHVVPVTRWALCLLTTLGVNVVSYATLRALRPEIRDVL